MNQALQIAQLLSVLSRVDGRKKFQKLVHILQELGYPFNERFEYSYYGMYSRQLRGELDTLSEAKLIIERVASNAGGHSEFSFEKTGQLDTLLEEVGVQNEPQWSVAAKKLNALSPQVLEGISTIMYLQRCGFAGDPLKARLLSLKPHLVDCYDKCVVEAKGIESVRSRPDDAVSWAG